MSLNIEYSKPSYNLKSPEIYWEAEVSRVLFPKSDKMLDVDTQSDIFGSWLFEIKSDFSATRRTKQIKNRTYSDQSSNLKDKRMHSSSKSKGKTESKDYLQSVLAAEEELRDIFKIKRPCIYQTS